MISLSFTACEEVVDLDLNTAEPRLVIDASLTWFKGTDGKNQSIKLSLSAPFYATEVPPANNAVVQVKDTHNNTFTFVEDGDTGVYENDGFIAELNGEYTISITYNDEVYTGTEKLMPVSDIDYVDQKDDGGFSGEDIEIKAYYTDPEGVDNYYLFEFDKAGSNHVSLNVYDDEFNDGNQIFAFYSDDEFLDPGDELTIFNSGISERFYQFMVVLLQQSDDEGGDPFETQPATVRGNCVNETNPENYPFGYFRASEVATFKYIIKSNL